MYIYIYISLCIPYTPCIVVYSATKLGDFCWANVGIHIPALHHGSYLIKMVHVHRFSQKNLWKNHHFSPENSLFLWPLNGEEPDHSKPISTRYFSARHMFLKAPGCCVTWPRRWWHLPPSSRIRWLAWKRERKGYPLLISSMAGWKIPSEWRFLARKITV